MTACTRTCQTRLADAITLSFGGSQVPTNAHSVQVVAAGISGRPCDYSRIVGNPEVILGPRFVWWSGSQRLYILRENRKLTHHRSICVIDTKNLCSV